MSGQSVRAYHPSDFPILDQWAKSRVIEMSPYLLSPNGFVCCDERGPIAMVWVYQICGVPFVALDNFFSRPQSSVRQVRDAWAAMFRVIKNFISKMRNGHGELIGYKLIRTFCRAELGRFFKEDGWMVAERPSLQITYALP